MRLAALAMAAVITCTAPGVFGRSSSGSYSSTYSAVSSHGTYGSCPGYVIDHIKPLKRGGADAPSNMQWQTEGAAKQKDRWE